jgi:hypothetical protein
VSRHAAGNAVTPGREGQQARPGDALWGSEGATRQVQGPGRLTAARACFRRVLQACSSGIVVRCPTGMCCDSGSCQIACSSNQACCAIETSSCNVNNPSFTNTARKCTATCSVVDPLFQPQLYSTYNR